MKRYYLFMIAVICLLPVVVWLVVFAQSTFSSTPEDWATFGNYLSGTVGVLSTLAGFAIIYMTYAKQVNDSYLTSFENTLFKLVDYQRNIMSNITSGKEAAQGFPSFSYWAVEFTTHLITQLNAVEKNNVFYPNAVKLIQDLYPKAYSHSLYRIGNYFRHLYHIFKYINESRLPVEQRQKYAKLIRAQLSTEEMVLIGIDGMTTYGDKFKPIIEKYSLLHRLMSFDFWRAIFISFYEKDAFGDEDIEETLPIGNENEIFWYKLLEQRIPRINT